MLNPITTRRPVAPSDEFNSLQKVWSLVRGGGTPRPSAAAGAVRRYTCCSHPQCIRGSGALKNALIREGQALGLTLDVTETTTVCPGYCRSGPFVGLPKLHLFYCNVQAAEARDLIRETTARGRLVFSKLLLDATKVTDGRILFSEEEELLILIEADYCLLEAAEYLLRFNARESCGKCFPCRYGVHRLAGLLQKLRQGSAKKPELEAIRKTAAAMARDSYCRFAAKVTAALRLLLKLRPEELEKHLETGCGRETLHLTEVKRG